MAPEGSSVLSPTGIQTTPSENLCDVHRTTASSIITALCYGVLIPPTVIGNGLVVVAFIINPKIRTATNIFILGLAFSDLLIGIFSLPLWTYIVSHEPLSAGHCFITLYQVYICMDILSGCASILQLTSIAIERLFFTVSPLRHRKLPRSVYYIMVVAAWLFSIFVAALQPVQIEAWEQVYSLFLLVTCFIFPLFVIIFVYLYILKKARHQARPRRSTRQRVGSSGGYIKEFNIFFTVIVITGIFVLAWMPFFILSVVATICPACLPPAPQVFHLVKFVKWMQYSSSSVNPYIYAYRNIELKKTYRRILRSCLCGCNNTTSWQNSNSKRESACKKNRTPSGLPDSNPDALSGYGREQVYVNKCFNDSLPIDHQGNEVPGRLSFDNINDSNGQPKQQANGLVGEVYLGPREGKIALKPQKLRKEGGGSFILKKARVENCSLNPRRGDRGRSCSVNDMLSQQSPVKSGKKYTDVHSERARKKSHHKPIPEFHAGDPNVRATDTRVNEKEQHLHSSGADENNERLAMKRYGQTSYSQRDKTATSISSATGQNALNSRHQNGEIGKHHAPSSSRAENRDQTESASYV